MVKVWMKSIEWFQRYMALKVWVTTPQFPPLNCHYVVTYWALQLQFFARICITSYKNFQLLVFEKSGWQECVRKETIIIIRIIIRRNVHKTISLPKLRLGDLIITRRNCRNSYKRFPTISRGCSGMPGIDIAKT